MKKWKRCGSRKRYRVDFALGPATVKLVSFFDGARGRVYHVEDVQTGRRDVVGAEVLSPVAGARRRRGK